MTGLPKSRARVSHKHRQRATASNSGFAVAMPLYDVAGCGPVPVAPVAPVAGAGVSTAANYLKNLIL